MKLNLLAIGISLIITACNSYPIHEKTSLPDGFISLNDVDSSIQLDIRYYGSNNFIGRPIDGYFTAKCLLTLEAATALVKAQQQSLALGYSLKVYDCYRPQRSVTDFVSWSSDPDDNLVQHRFYPAIQKNQLFPQGYIASQSGHSRGSTIDITLVPVGSQQPAVDPFANRYDCRASLPRRYPDNSIDMGSEYDCFDEISQTANPNISDTAKQNRNLLKSIMADAGLDNYDQEWWHYTLVDEPFPNTYFDFPIE